MLVGLAGGRAAASKPLHVRVALVGLVDAVEVAAREVRRLAHQRRVARLARLGRVLPVPAPFGALVVPEAAFQSQPTGRNICEPRT